MSLKQTTVQGAAGANRVADNQHTSVIRPSRRQTARVVSYTVKHILPWLVPALSTLIAAWYLRA